MASNVPLEINGFYFTFLMGQYRGDMPIALHPANFIDSPEYFEALKKAVEISVEYGNLESKTYRRHEYSGLEEAYQLLKDIESIREKFPELAKYNEWHDGAIEDCNKFIERQLRKQSVKKTTAPPSRTGFVYLLKSSTGNYKIGRAKNPDDRLKTFNVKLPFEVVFDCLIASENMHALESELHNRFAHKRVNGEWFALDLADVEYIKGLAL